jgi:GNAT superfamily N-acetyltransferase
MTHPIHQSPFRIVSAGKDIDPMYSLSQKAEWNQTIDDLMLLAARDPKGNLLGVADIDGVSKPLGSGMVLNIGESLAWLGMILVHPEHRRQGIASAIMEQCIEVARLAMDNSIVGLDATPAGLQVYKNIGFQKSFKIWRCKLQTEAIIQIDASIEVIRNLSMYKYTDMLRDMNLHTKFAGLRVIQKIHPEGVWVAQAKGKPIGMVMTRPGRLKPFIGPLLAAFPGAARTLLDHVLKYWKEKGHDEVFMDIPEKHFNSASRWESEMVCITPPEDCVLGQGVEAARCFIRMYEMISEENFSLLATRKADGNKHARDVEALKHARSSYAITVEHMKKELESLEYLFAVGGPELS